MAYSSFFYYGTIDYNQLLMQEHNLRLKFKSLLQKVYALDQYLDLHTPFLLSVIVLCLLLLPRISLPITNASLLRHYEQTPLQATDYLIVPLWVLLTQKASTPAELHLHYIIQGLTVYSLGYFFLRRQHRSVTPSIIWSISIATTLLFFSLPPFSSPYYLITYYQSYWQFATGSLSGEQYYQVVLSEKLL